jgi:hypothetical protein
MAMLFKNSMPCLLKGAAYHNTASSSEIGLEICILATLKIFSCFGDGLYLCHLIFLSCSNLTVLTWAHGHLYCLSIAHVREEPNTLFATLIRL